MTEVNARAPRRVHLAAHFPGVNNTTIWQDPRAGSQVEFASFEHFARNAERGIFDYLFLAEGLRLREHRGQVHELDVIGRPNTLAILSAIAAVTEHIGLVGTLSATFNEPYELARQLATLDHLSAGRSGWNIVTTADAFHGANFRRGAFLPHAERYERAAEFLQVARTLWGSWTPDATGRARATMGSPHTISHHGKHFTLEGRFSVPRPPQGSPVIVQAGDSDQGREFAAAHSDLVYTRHNTYDASQAFYQDVKGRLHKYGRELDDLKILPAITFTLGDSREDAEEKAAAERRLQYSGPNALALLEQVWGRDLSSYDPDGPLPDVDPVTDSDISRGRVQFIKDPHAVVRKWRDLAEQRDLSIRELVLATQGRQNFIGTARDIAHEMNRYVQNRATDGFVVIPTISPSGLDDFTDRVIPELQDLGVYPTKYGPGTLRDRLGFTETKPAECPR